MNKFMITVTFHIQTSLEISPVHVRRYRGILRTTSNCIVHIIVKVAQGLADHNIKIEVGC